jgi:tripartite-type tricarboxylate transporter receptor subunit TctC
VAQVLLRLDSRDRVTRLLLTYAAQSVRHLLRVTAVSTTLMVLLSGSQSRADWPERPITIIVPFAQGGATDLLGRLLAARLTMRLGKQVTVENSVGEVGNVGLRAAARATPNGYTLLVTSNAALINLALNPALSMTSYNTPKDFAPIAYLGDSPNVMVARPSSEIDSIAGLIAKAKANPGRLTFASPGVGSSSGMAVELLELRAGINVNHISLNGSDMALHCVLSGGARVAAIGLGGMIDHIRSGELKALVQTGDQRWFDLPNVPTMAEAGIPNAVLETSFMFAAPAGTPVMVIDKLTRATKEILERPDTKSQMLNVGVNLQYEGPEDLQARIMRELLVWEDIVRHAGLDKS